MPQKKLIYLILILTTLLVLSSCGKSSSINNQSNLSAGQAQYYIEMAQRSSGIKRADWLLLASEALLSLKRTDKALRVLNRVVRTEMNDKAKQLHHLLTAQALSLAGRTEQALQQYTQISQITLLKKYQQISYHRAYAELLTNIGRNYESALQRIALSELITDQLEQEENTELLWQSLKQVTNLNIYRNSLNQYLVAGWVELANLAKVHTGQPDILLKNLELWRQSYFDHPANKRLPIDMARAEAAKSYRPDVIALLLPEQGNLASSAKQIRNGFLTAIYDLPIDKRPEILFFDSSESADIQSLYQDAVDTGASFVIGPLRRQSVETLARLEYFPVPVLSINRLSNDLAVPQNFYQFGLPVEDEAIEVATKAWQDGFSKAIVLAPAGTIGDRTTKAFVEQFERLGGETQQVVNFNGENDYSRAIQSLLGVDKSLSRFSKLKQQLGVPLKHEARRRQDADFLFFKASVKQARRIKPFIDFYYAHDLPLYSTSSIYNGKEEALLDRDLDKVQFCDIPWLLSDDLDILNRKKQLSTLWPKSVETHSARLFALGYDLFTLIPDLNKLKNFPNYQKLGLSGTLSVDQQGHVKRKLSWAKFTDGIAVPVTESFQ